MFCARAVIAVLLIISPGITPVWGVPGAAFGTIIAADKAHVGNAVISAGATVFGGDKLLTEAAGTVQIRAGAARLLLSSSSSAILGKDQAPTATLTRGTAIFSTANSKAFTLHVGSAVIKPQTDQPTIAQVSVVGPKQMVVRSTRGSVSFGVEDDVRVIPEGMAYRIVLDPTEAELAASEASVVSQEPPQDRVEDRVRTQPVSGSRSRSNRARKPSRNKFVWFAIGVTGVATFFALSEAWESADRPQQ
jgi:hypothetical protein